MSAALAHASGKMLAHKAGGVGTMTFNNPEKRNAVSFEMWRAAEAILQDFAADPEVRVVVLTGAGDKAFVSGADISRFETERADPEAVARYNAQTEATHAALHDFPKPTIALIRGFCVGGGLGIATHCDLRYATEDARFALPAAKLGLGYGYVALKRLAEVVGLPFAKEIAFTARLFTAAEAERMGLVNRIVPAADIEAAVAETAATIAGNAPLTIAAAKYAFGQIGREPADRDLDGAARRVAACFGSRDYAEGRRAFMEKRRPLFEGA